MNRVIGLRTFFHFETSLKAGNSLSSLLKRTVTPILGVPANDADKPFKRALIAYDGSMNSARTLREFVAFAKPYEFSITIATADLDARHALWHLEEAAGYFRAHGVEDFDTRHIKEKSIPDYIVDEYDLIVAGIHSGRLVKDRFVGSFTNRLIDRDDKTLFLSH
ncbi:MAG: universal stress protein [Verrucomicrobiales bacterium]|nr:universal stress protein [Verrucomicrobiales bacterium]